MLKSRNLSNKRLILMKRKIFVTTHNANRLLEKIYEQINKKKILTWGVDSDGDFTHTPEQWDELGWLKPEIINWY